MKKLVILVIIILSGCSFVQPNLNNHIEDDYLNKYQVDFIEIANYVKNNHCSFYKEPLQVMNFEEYSILVNKIKEEMKSIEDDDNFYIKLYWFLEKLKDGHTKIYNRFMLNANISLWWIEEKLLITAVRGDTSSTLLYKEIKKFGRISVQDYEEKINEYISADIGNELYKRLFSPDLMVSYAFLKKFELLNEDNSLDIEYLDGSTTKKYTINFSNYYPNSYRTIPESCRNNITMIKEGNWYKSIIENNTMYIQLNSLPNDTYIKFWEELFKNVKEMNSKAIIIDLRNNGGGSSNWCNEFLRYIIKEDRNIYMYKGWKSNYPNNNVAVSDGIQYIKAIGSELHFNGKVILLTSAKTFSSATFFVVAIKDNNLGLVIGEPVGNSSIRFGYMADSITLSNTRIKFSTTKYVWGRSLPYSINLNDMYIYPDENISISINDIVNHKDSVFEKAIDIIDQ